MDKPESPCRLVAAFLDKNGCKAFVINTSGKAWFSVRQKVVKHGTHCVKIKALLIRKTFDEAQHDLNVYARKNGWIKILVNRDDLTKSRSGDLGDQVLGEMIYQEILKERGGDLKWQNWQIR